LAGAKEAIEKAIEVKKQLLALKAQTTKKKADPTKLGTA